MNDLSESEPSAVATKLDKLMPDPHWLEYTVDHLPEPSAEVVVRKALPEPEMKSIEELVKLIRTTPGCTISPPAALPGVHGYSLPPDLIAFYSECGGAELFQNEAYGITLVAPSEFVKANPVIAGVEGGDDISADWFIIAKSGQQYVTIDLNTARLGRCYDSFWDRHAVAGSCPIIANSYTEFVWRLIQSRGQIWFWTSPDFISYGDAYEKAP